MNIDCAFTLAKFFPQNLIASSFVTEPSPSKSILVKNALSFPVSSSDACTSFFGIARSSSSPVSGPALEARSALSSSPGAILIISFFCCVCWYVSIESDTRRSWLMSGTPPSDTRREFLRSVVLPAVFSEWFISSCEMWPNGSFTCFSTASLIASSTTLSIW